MVSQLKVNEIIKQSGSSITIGESGDTINIGTTGDTINLAGATYAAASSEPLFHATLSADTTISHDTLIVTPCDNTTFNLGSAYSTSTYKFTPQTAGKYYIYTYAQCNMSAGEAKYCLTYIVKNSTTIVSTENLLTNSSGSRLGNTAVAIVDLNGSSDYVQAKVLPGTGSGTITLKSDSDTKTNFGGFKLV